MKASDLFLKCLEAEGIEYMFGVPGEENSDIMLSLKDSKINFVTTRHEQGAAFMADGYARISGKPAVCLGTLGPGAANLVTGVGNGNMDLSPMLVLTGQGAVGRLHKESHQNMDVVKMFEPITKWNQQIKDETLIPEIVRKAVKIARTERTGATHVELPEDLAKKDTDVKPLPVTPIARSQASSEDVAAAAEMIKNAKKPLILAGNACMRNHEATAVFRKLIETTGISVAQTMMAKGMLPIEHNRNLFTIGLGAKDHVSYAFDEADLVIAIGYGMVEYHPNKWNPNADKKIIHIDVVDAEADNCYAPAVELVGDIALILAQLDEACSGMTPFSDEMFSQYRFNMLHDIHKEKDSDAFPVHPAKILYDIREEMGSDDIVMCDVGAHKMWTARYYQADEPRTCHISNGFCSMGFALPGAMGAKLAAPDKKVLAICGDGAFMMNVQDLETAVRLQLPIVVTVWNNEKYGLIKWKQDVAHGESYGNEFGNVDFVKLAESMGALGYRVEKTADLAPTLAKAFESKDKPVVIDLPVDDAANDELSEYFAGLVDVYKS